jgi:hypothetical protein
MTGLRVHRWWLALAAALLTPWIGPHLDSYIPIGQVLLRARHESANAGFWVIAVVLVMVAYGAWFALLSVVSAWLARRRQL